VVKVEQENEIEKEEEKIEEEGEMNEQNIANYFQRALMEGKEVSKFTLELHEWTTLGSAVSGWGIIIPLYGEIEKVLLDTKYKYLISITKTYAIVPKTDFVFLVYTSASDFGGQLQYDTILYAFSRSTGWKSINLS